MQYIVIILYCVMFSVHMFVTKMPVLYISYGCDNDKLSDFLKGQVFIVFHKPSLIAKTS